MENEHYYRNELEKIMNKFIESETKTENDFGWISGTLSKRMADAAFSVLQTSQELNEWLKNEDLLES